MQTSRYRSTGYYPSYFPPGVKWLLIVNTAVFVLDYFAQVLFNAQPFALFGLVPAFVMQYGMVWQLFTYMFLHGGIWHILFNMLALWMFGVDLERDWGTRQFLKYYFLCGISAGFCVILAALVFGGMGSRTIGSSGAIFGVLLAFGMVYPDRIVLMSFLFPMKAKYFVMIMGAIAFLSSFQANSGVSDVAHLGGMFFGYLYLRLKLSRGPGGPLRSLHRQFQEWKLRRTRKKFQVYMKKEHSDRDRRVN